jgi:hypothetical protein
MKDILGAIVKVCTETHVPMAEEVFGKPGLDAIFHVMETAQELYRHVEPERIAGEVIIFETIAQSDPKPQKNATELPADFSALANQDVKSVVLEVAIDGRVYNRTKAVSAEELAKTAIVYRYREGREEFLAGNHIKPVLRLDPIARSQFSIPTFSNLRDALQNYAVESVRESTCYIFNRVWADRHRLFFKAAPETDLRRSLTQFLRNRFGADHDVWPEQVVDESHPVDIRMMPKFSNNRLMLIEIKWLGFSIAEDGHITARHKEPRAQEGADQLAQYLDDQLRYGPSHVIQGYYVIIDGRRENLREGAATISRADGMHFEPKEIPFDPAPHETRKDFDQPYRMFARPICSD